MANDIVEAGKRLNQVEIFDLERQKFQFMVEKARFYATSTMVPVQYRTFVTKKVKVSHPGGGWNMEEQVVENAAAMGNCLIIMDLANRIGMSETMLMQVIDVIEGKPRWSGKGAISAIDSCGRFSRLEWIEEDLGEKEVEYSEYFWEKGEKKEVKKKIKIRDRKFIAYATDIKSGKLLKSPEVTLEIAVKEGWYTKAGSKWQTLTQIMGQRRSASWFADSYCPDVLMGMRTAEEEDDIAPIDLFRGEDGVFQGEATVEPEVKADPISDLKDTLSGKKKTSKAKTQETKEPEPTDNPKPVDAEFVAPEDQGQTAEDDISFE